MLNEDEVKKVADLARLRLNDKEITKYSQDLAAILEYFKGLSEVDTENIEPLYNTDGSSNVLDADEIRESEKIQFYS